MTNKEFIRRLKKARGLALTEIWMEADKLVTERDAALRQIAMLREALEAFDKSAKESASIIGFAGKALKLLHQARAALTATAADVEAWEKQRRDAVLEEAAELFDQMNGRELFHNFECAGAIRALKDKP